MEVKQTAVEWLLEELLNRDWYHLSESIKNEIIQQAKEIEKEQKIEFAINVFHARHDTESIFLAAERTLNNK